MKKSAFLAWITALSIVASIVVFVTLTVVLWPPDLPTSLLLAGLLLLPAIATLALLIRRQIRPVPWKMSAEETAALSDQERAEYRLEALADYERGLEYRELRLARQIRTSRQSNPGYLDLLQPDPSDEELEALVVNDRKLVVLIETESQLAFNRILENRYADEDGVNTGLILADVREFIEKVARLYRPDSDDILLETEIELIAKSLSSVSLHLLMVVDDLPLNLKTYNTAKMYRLIRRSARYYGTYKSFRPYLEHGLNAFQLARLALGMNPVAVGSAWLAGKLSTHGAKAVGERLLQRKALQLLSDFIRVIGFEAAMMYGGDFAHRDANWVFGAELVNLEISRRDDLAGRDAALQALCSLVLRNEFDRINLLTSLARHKPVDIERARPKIIMTLREREDVAARLAKHCRQTGVDLDQPELIRWQGAVEATLAMPFSPLDDDVEDKPASQSSRRARLKARWNRLRGRAPVKADDDPGET